MTETHVNRCAWLAVRNKTSEKQTQGYRPCSNYSDKQVISHCFNVHTKKLTVSQYSWTHSYIQYIANTGKATGGAKQIKVSCPLLPPSLTETLQRCDQQVNVLLLMRSPCLLWPWRLTTSNRGLDYQVTLFRGYTVHTVALRWATEPIELWNHNNYSWGCQLRLKPLSMLVPSTNGGYILPLSMEM